MTSAIRLRIGAHLEQLAEDPRLRGTAPLHGDLKGQRKLRLGDYRIVSSVDNEGSAARALAIGHRGRACRAAARRE